MVDRDTVIVPSDPIGQPPPTVRCARLLYDRVACFGKHHNCLTPMCESIGIEGMIAGNTAVGSGQIATLRQDFSTDRSRRVRVPQIFTHANGMEA
jgi:hypothetical protein